MPYSIFEINNEYCVYRVDDNGARIGESLGCHESNDLAGEQIAAIETSEANKAGRVISSKNGNALMQAIRVIADLLRGAGIEPDIDPSEVGVDTDHGMAKEVALLTQEEAGYVVESPHDPPVACATCKYFIPRNERDDMPACHLVKSIPEPIMPQGWCTLYEVREGDEYTEADEEGVIELTPEPLEKRFLGIFPRADSQFKMLRTDDGRRIMAQITSNKWLDRDGEIVSAAALQDYVDSMWHGDEWVGGQKQVFWHMDHTKYPIGELVWAGVIKGFLTEFFMEEPNLLAKIVYDEVEQNPTGWASSMGFKYSKKEFNGKIYKRIRKFETTVLPREYAANIYTDARVL